MSEADFAGELFGDSVIDLSDESLIDLFDDLFDDLTGDAAFQYWATHKRHNPIKSRVHGIHQATQNSMNI